MAITGVEMSRLKESFIIIEVSISICNSLCKTFRLIYFDHIIKFIIRSDLRSSLHILNHLVCYVLTLFLSKDPCTSTKVSLKELT